MTHHRTIGNVAVVLSLTLGSVAHAQPRPSGGPPPRPPRIELIIAEHAAELGISDAAVRAVRDLVNEAVPRLEALHDALRQAIEAARDAEAGRIERSLRERERALMESIRALFTDEQWGALLRYLPPPPPPMRAD